MAFVKKAVYSVLILLFFTQLIFSQDEKDSLSITIHSGFQLSSQKEFLPHYLVMNQWGIVDEDDTFYGGASLNYDYQVSPKILLSTGGSFRNDIAGSYYLNFRKKELFINIGRTQRVVGGLNNGLGTGSLDVSNNALPIPQISAGIDEFINFPFAQGYLKFKGYISQGWFESGRFIEDPLLHSKSVSVMIDLTKIAGLRFFSSMTHNAMYGGILQGRGALINGFSDFLKVFSGKGTGSEPIQSLENGERNALGSHLGTVSTQIEKDFKSGDKLILNFQDPWEDSGSLSYIGVKEYLIGLEWTKGKSSWFEKIYIEWMQTKLQSGPGVSDRTPEVPDRESNFGYTIGQRDDNYNNYLYRNGWTYQGMIIGNSLFTTYDRAVKFFGIFPDYEVDIANNRIRAFTAGIKGDLANDLAYRAKFTYSENFGTYTGLYEGRLNWNGIITNPDFEYVYRPGKIQNYSLLEIDYKTNLNRVPIILNLKLAHDFGDIYKATGVQFTVFYRVL